MPTEQVEVGWEARLPGTTALVGFLITAHLLVGLAQWGAGHATLAEAWLWSRAPDFREASGGQVRALVDDGQGWRLLTSVGLHADAVHVAVNGVAVAALGRV